MLYFCLPMVSDEFFLLWFLASMTDYMPYLQSRVYYSLCIVTCYDIYCGSFMADLKKICISQI